MDRLKGKTILIGKTPGQAKLCIGVLTLGQSQPKVAIIDTPIPVPNCVSRCKPAEGTAHCKIDVDSSGGMILTNIKPENSTYVDGLKIASKKITTSSIVTLGKDKYQIDINKVLNGAKQALGATTPVPQNPVPQPTKTYNIKHLEYVWNNFQESRREVAANTKRITLIRSACGIFTMCVVPCCFFFGPIAYVLTAIGVIGNIYSFVGLKNDDSAKKLEDINDKFQDQYVCPNPDCNKHFGAISYKFLKKQYSMQCPYCKSKYVEQ